MDGITEQPRRGRPPRAETAVTEQRRERRYNPEANTDITGLKLVIPSWVKEKYPESQFVHRWFANKPGRLDWAHTHDWDRIEGVNEVHATDDKGAPANHVLHIKRRDWFEDDRTPREDARKSLEKQMERGIVKASPSDGGDGETLSTQFQYAEATASNRLS